jgi:glycerol-3-phosphate dehydrogenase
MNRQAMLDLASQTPKQWDFIIIGGGATGAGIAVDAATRGYSALLLERADFGVGTSSRSTKLVHGGVRYLRQGHISVVFEALQERGRLKANAPHLVQDLAFILPCYQRRELLLYGLGLKAYDWLAGSNSFGRSIIVPPRTVYRNLPTIQARDLRGGVLYHDGQFDDARLLIHLLMTAVDFGACVLNYAAVTDFLRESTGRIVGVLFSDQESGRVYQALGKIIVNAAGPFCDELRQLAQPISPKLLTASRGSHLVLPHSFLPGKTALLVPRTPDGRVLFAIPWHGHTLVGTTDIPTSNVPAEPQPTAEEIDYLLETVGRYLIKQPERSDVLASFAGIRPLLKSDTSRTSTVRRDYILRCDIPGLVTITGGKWTTYRRMAEVCVNHASILAALPPRRCITHQIAVHGSTQEVRNDWLSVYGTDARHIEQLCLTNPELARPLHPAFPYIEAEVIWAVRSEMARTLTDVLARRLRALVLNTNASLEMAPRVAQLMARELNYPATWVADQLEQLKRSTH